MRKKLSAFFRSKTGTNILIILFFFTMFVIDVLLRNQYESDEAYNKGYDAGYWDGQSDFDGLLEEKYDNGYEDGFVDGQYEAQMELDEERYSIAYDDGYEEGYDEGYDWGQRFGYSSALSGISDPNFASFVGDTDSKTVHRFFCYTGQQSNNPTYFFTLTEAESSGYTPCIHCNPFSN